MKDVKKLAASWGRSFFAGAVTLYLAGVSDPKALLGAGLAAVLPVILRWVNPKDVAFGKIS